MSTDASRTIQKEYDRAAVLYEQHAEDGNRREFDYHAGLMDGLEYALHIMGRPEE